MSYLVFLASKMVNGSEILAGMEARPPKLMEKKAFLVKIKGRAAEWRSLGGGMKDKMWWSFTCNIGGKRC